MKQTAERQLHDRDAEHQFAFPDVVRRQERCEIGSGEHPRAVRG